MGLKTCSPATNTGGRVKGEHLVKNLLSLEEYPVPNVIEIGLAVWISIENIYSNKPTRNNKGGKCHCTVDLLFDWFGLVCFANKNKNCQLSYN
jgi:hypothetical protein